MTINNDLYKDIRPYHDDEVKAALKRLIQDDTFINAIITHKFSHHQNWFRALVSPWVKLKLKIRWNKLKTVADIQHEVSEYMDKALAKTTTQVTYTGIDKLDPSQSYLFISNHRDIAMDPALVNWGLFKNQHDTVRIAIGDNLLTMPCATELMKLNKSFVVNRSAKGPREMMKAVGTLSAYIKDSLEENQSIWIAQKEGRAKDGDDKTDPAILKMFYVHGRKQKISFAEYMQSLNIVPVSISYENDPCDLAKANELSQIESTGTYQKSQNEDIESIIQGIIGYKGNIHVHFGDVLTQAFDTPEELALEIDRQIHKGYQLYPINYLAAGEAMTQISAETKQLFEQKLQALGNDGARQKLKTMYANPVYNAKKLEASKQED